MQEKRKFNRWYPVMDFTTSVAGEGFRENVRVMDISAAGMKAFMVHPATIGASVYSKLEIPFNDIPFFVRGEVMRASLLAGKWEIAIRFNKVSTVPITANAT